MPRTRKADPLRIGIDARLAFRRGVGTYAANLILSLAKIDHRNEYVIFNAPDALKDRIRGANFSWIETYPANPAHYEQILLPRTAVGQGVELLHYVDNSASVLGWLPFVVTLHDTMHTRSIQEARPRPSLRQRALHFYKRWSIVRSAPRARGVLTVSEASRRDILASLRVEQARLHVTLEGVDRSKFRRGPRKHSSWFKILVQAAADKRKNLTNILKAAKLLAEKRKDFQLLIMGMDEREMKSTPYLREELDLGLQRQVEWAGSVPPERLAELYAEADLLLYPSLWEGFGLPVLEAFACGVPVVTSTTTSLPEVAGDAALLVDPARPEAIARGVERIMRDAALRRRCVQRGLRRAKLFTWERTARLTKAVYETATRGPA